MSSNLEIKPFLKWAGGKTQLLNDIGSYLPNDIQKSKKIDKYFEPFLGGGAVFFYLASNFSIKDSYISDLNEDLILCYSVIKNNSKDLIKLLGGFQEDYVPFNQEQRKEYYINIRSKFNQNKDKINLADYFDKNIEYPKDKMEYPYNYIERAAFFIFMNKTCFNGLFRVNSKGEFNVPVGRQKKPLICDKNNLKNISKILKNVHICYGDFSIHEKFIDNTSLVYLDPPYRPITKTSFIEYGPNKFNENDQKRLHQFFVDMDKKGAKLILNNSDPTNTNPNDCFFIDLYGGYTIKAIGAKRYINSVGSKRGEINELLITNINDY